MRRLLVIIFVGIITGIGIFWYQKIRSTPEASMQAFTHDIAVANSDAAYSRLTDDLIAGREQYWRDYLAQFKTAQPPELKSTELLHDTFNTYSAAHNPRRFKYDFYIQEKTYQMTIITVRQEKTWKVTELHGAYLK